MRAATAAFLVDDLEVIKTQFAENYGVKDVEAKIQLFQSLMGKWKGLAAEAGADSVKLGDLYWTHVQSKIDPATYGVN